MAIDFNNIQLPSLNFSGMLGNSAVFVKWLIGLIILGGIAYILYVFISYDKRIIIFKNTATGRKIIVDKGKLIVKDNITTLRTLWTKQLLPEPIADQIYPGKKETILYEWVGDMQMHPVMVEKRILYKEVEDLEKSIRSKILVPIAAPICHSPQQSDIKIIPSNILQWNLTMKRKKLEALKKPSLWQQIGPILGITIMAAVFLIMVILILDKFSILASVASSLQATAEALRDVNTQTITG